MQANETQPIILCAGGTGGHMFPAFALAGELRARGREVHFITDGRGAKYRDQYPGITFHIIRADTLRPGLLSKIKTAIKLTIGVIQSIKVLWSVKPFHIVGFGGYPSFPPLLISGLLKIPYTLHEQNAVLGRANKMLAGCAQHLALSWPSDVYKDKAVVTGNPVRADIELIGKSEYNAPSVEGDFNIFVMGGSLGATVFSKMLPSAIELLDAGLKLRLRIVQQCRASDIDEVRARYDAMKINADLKTFFDDVPEQLRRAHVVVARSGGSTVAEIAASGRPAIFVPYPHHKDQQQKANAAALVQAGGAVLMEEPGLTPMILAECLAKLMVEPARLSEMAAQAHGCCHENAAKLLADVIIGR